MDKSLVSLFIDHSIDQIACTEAATDAKQRQMKLSTGANYTP